MGLRRHFQSQPLERRLFLAIEPLFAGVPVGADEELSVQSAAISGAAGGPGAGRSLVVYSDRDDATGKGKDVFLRRFEPDGQPFAAPAMMNTTTNGAQMNPDVAVNENGAFAVVWQSENQDGSGWGVYARYFEPAAALATGEILVNQTTGGAQVAPRVAIAADGGFVVAWVGRDDNGGNGTVYARRFGANGVAVTNETAVTANGNFAHTAPDVAIAAGGVVAVAWVTSDIANAGQTDVSARRLDATTLAPLAAAVTLNATTAGDQAEPAIAALAGGDGFLIAFSDASNGTGEATILARRLDDAGGVDPAPVQVSQDSDGHRSRPQVSSAGATTIVGWTQQPLGASSSATVTRAFGDGGLVPTSNEAIVTDGVSARTLYGIAVVGDGRFRDVVATGEFAGYGTAATATLANVLRLDGTAGDDEIIVTDLNASTVRATVNGASLNFTRASYDHVRVELGAGDDVLDGTGATLWADVEAGIGDDTLTGTSAADQLRGGDGNDRVDVAAGDDYALGGDGDDVMYGREGGDTLTGGAGRDTIYGGRGVDRVAGSGSPDRLYGEEDADRVYGDGGDDRCDGGGGVDRVFGGLGRDELLGGSSNDRLYADEDDDTLNGNAGNDHLDGGDGVDLALRREPGDTLIRIESP